MRGLQIFSLPGDRLVRGDGDILADAAECTNFVAEQLSGMDALAHRERVSIVVELHLRLARLAFVDSAYTWVLLVEPRALHISLLLRVVALGVQLTDQVGNLVRALHFESTHVISSLNRRVLCVLSDS